jgi:hypothetical protein
LKRICLKWVRMTHLSTLNISYGQKNGPRVKVSIWLLTTKNQESPWNTCVHVVWHILLESSQQGLQLCFKPHLNQKFAQEIMSFQSAKSSNFGNLGLPSWESWNKMTLDVAPVANHRKYYKGEGGGFPQGLVGACKNWLRSMHSTYSEDLGGILLNLPSPIYVKEDYSTKIKEVI